MVSRIIMVRKEKNLTQEQFANNLGMSRSFINQVETGKRNISDRTISDICSTFNVNEVWLRTGVGEMFRQNTRKESITDFIGQVMHSEPDDIRRRIIDIMSRMTVEDWEFINKRLRELVEESLADNK